jgi:hypothetical protein
MRLAKCFKGGAGSEDRELLRAVRSSFRPPMQARVLVLSVVFLLSEYAVVDGEWYSSDA